MSKCIISGRFWLPINLLKLFLSHGDIAIMTFRLNGAIIPTISQTPISQSKINKCRMCKRSWLHFVLVRLALKTETETLAWLCLFPCIYLVSCMTCFHVNILSSKIKNSSTSCCIPFPPRLFGTYSNRHGRSPSGSILFIRLHRWCFK